MCASSHAGPYQHVGLVASADGDLKVVAIHLRACRSARSPLAFTSGRIPPTAQAKAPPQ